MDSDEHGSRIAQRLAGPAVIAVVAALAVAVVTLPLNAALKQREFWAIAGIAVALALVAALALTIRSAARARTRIAALEAKLAEYRDELDRVKVLVARLTPAALPQWLSVAITYAERTGGRVDVVHDGLRFVTADQDGEWTVHLPLSADDSVWTLERDELHRVLGIDQHAYMTALLDPAT